ncbi:phosphate ABC transporter substrate-binding/OmpA family protein [Rhodophyticola porphyridii]|uniref:phosphate ABC transporter substrate-binding/OmpA family protein n=1 Tax=Rhodophyticola porphyridii TaxID=1852017 RepID=UPI0035D0BCE8
MHAWLRAAFGAAFFGITGLSPAVAQDVTLRSLDGSIELDGSLIGFDGEFYRVDTIYGPLTVNAEGVSCAGPGCPDLESFVAEARFAGASVIADRLMPALIEGFARARGMTVSRALAPDGRSVFTLTRSADGTTAARFTLIPGTTDSGFEALLNRDADLALALREPSPVERDAARLADQGDLGLSQRARVLAIDGLVAVVSPENPLRDIALSDLARVFAGEITNWAVLGGGDAPISLNLMRDDSGLAQGFANRVLLPAGLGLGPGIIRHTTQADLSGAVARDPYAIGITSYAGLGNARALALGGPCGFSQTASAASLKAEDYPLTAPLFVYTPARRMPRLVREFLSFFESQAAERVIRRAGFVNQSILRTPVSGQGDRLANAIAAAGPEITLEDLQRLSARISDSQRLSPTFRFAPGTTDLDPQSRSSVSRLARAIEQGRFDGQRLVFVGFSDGAGDAATNLRLARGRAETARRAVMEAANAADLNRVQLRVDAFGEAMPMACDDTEWGRAVNRRVEVWLE